MATTGRNDPCPCGSGKKYKNCCLTRSEAVSIAKYKYDKYLEVRNEACAKVFDTGVKDLKIDGFGPGFYLLDYLLFEPPESSQMRNADDFDNFLKDASFLFSIYGYPVHEAKLFGPPDIDSSGIKNSDDTEVDDFEDIDSFGFKLSILDIVKKQSGCKEDIENNYLWKYCLENFNNRFSYEEKKFLNSIKDSVPGFFKVTDINESQEEKEIAGCPVSTFEDIFTGKRYQVLDRLLSEGVVRHDIISGMLAPYNEIPGKEFYVLEGSPPVLYPPRDKPLILELIKEYSRIYRKEYRQLFESKINYPEIFKVFPIVLYLVAIHYFYHTISAPLPKLVNYDKEEIIFSRTFYKVKDREKVKQELINIKDFKLVEETKKKTVFDWTNEKNTLLATIYLHDRDLVLETNSLERLERWKKIIKAVPIEFEKTDYTYPEEMQKKFLKSAGKNRAGASPGKKEKSDIPEEALKEFALKWWEDYYNDWVNTKIPLLGNITPLEAMKTAQGRKNVEALLEDYENSYLHDIKRGTGGAGNMQKYFDPDELRRRLKLI
ncbi:MAG: hypothetical protein BWY64_02759 [bacterium ADurb.Bin363]|nr:MAG: hypothetical protein BWY64_02759 [bacterium ADurb.Bin363]